MSRLNDCGCSRSAFARRAAGIGPVRCNVDNIPSADKLTPDSGRSDRNRLLSRKTPRTMSAVSSEMATIGAYYA